MSQLETTQPENLPNNSSLKTKFTTEVDMSLREILNKLDDDNKSDVEEALKKNLLEIHRIESKHYHEMRRAFRDRRRYWDSGLDAERIIEEFNALPDLNNGVYKYLEITFKDGNNAFFNKTVVHGHRFCDYITCYSEVFLKELFNLYNNVRIVKSINLLTDANYGQRPYIGDVRMACIHCSDPKVGDIPEEDFFDVAHDPDNPLNPVNPENVRECN